MSCFSLKSAAVESLVAEAIAKLPEMIPAEDWWSSSCVLVTGLCGHTIKGSDVATLRKETWLNDTIIDVYLAMISARSKGNENHWPTVLSMTTFFYQTLENRGYRGGVEKWTRKDDIFGYDMILGK